VEVDVDNPDGAILPGAYATVRLNAQNAQPPVSIPSARWCSVRKRSSRIDKRRESGCMQSVTLGRDFGTRIEVTTGLDAKARVVANPSDAIASGERVNVAESPQTAPP